LPAERKALDAGSQSEPTLRLKGRVSHGDSRLRAALSRLRLKPDLSQWLGRHAVAAVLVVGLAAYAAYELSALVFAYTGDAYHRVEGPISRATVSDNATVTCCGVCGARLAL
jgi:hypothetical protein